MLSKVFSAANTGFNGKLVEIECDITGGIPGITIVGPPNKAIDEAKERMRSALRNTRLNLPPNGSRLTWLRQTSLKTVPPTT